MLRFGIPNFKLGKHIIDRRIRIMEQEGILFRVNTMVGKEILAKDVVKDFDAVCVAIGAEVPRDLSIEGRHLFRLGVIKPAEPDLRRHPHPAQKPDQLQRQESLSDWRRRYG